MHKTLYHITPLLNIDSIEALGLRPDFSEGRNHVLWLCDREKLPWAFAHISLRRKLRVDELMVCVVVLNDMALRNTRWHGVYTCRNMLIVSSYQSAETWLRRIEQRDL